MKRRSLVEKPCSLFYFIEGLRLTSEFCSRNAKAVPDAPLLLLWKKPFVNSTTSSQQCADINHILLY